MKLILKHSWYNPYVAAGTNTYPFEYSSKEEETMMLNLASEDIKEEYKQLKVKKD